MRVVPYTKKIEKLKNMKKISTLLIFFTALQITSLRAQIPLTHNLYYENGYAINPAAVFQNKLITASFNAQQTYAGFENAPQTNSLFLSGPVSEKVGLGLSVINARQGIFTINNFKGTYAYKLKMGERHFLGMGLSMGLSWEKTATGQIAALHPDDPLLRDPSYNDQKHFINEVGFLYQLKRLKIGLSSPYIVQSEYQHYLAYASMLIGAKEPSKGFSVSPMLLFQRLPTRINQLDAGLKIRYKPVWTAASMRSNGNIFLALGAQFHRFKVAYSYEFNNQSLANIADSNQEIRVAYSFNLKAKPGKEEIPPEQNGQSTEYQEEAMVE